MSTIDGSFAQTKIEEEFGDDCDDEEEKQGVDICSVRRPEGILEAIELDEGHELLMRGMGDGGRGKTGDEMLKFRKVSRNPARIRKEGISFVFENY